MNKMPAYVVIRSSESVKVLSRTGPFVGRDQDGALTAIRSEIERDGLGAYLDRRKPVG